MTNPTPIEADGAARDDFKFSPRAKVDLSAPKADKELEDIVYDIISSFHFVNNYPYKQVSDEVTVKLQALIDKAVVAARIDEWQEIMMSDGLPDNIKDDLYACLGKARVAQLKAIMEIKE